MLNCGSKLKEDTVVRNEKKLCFHIFFSLLLFWQNCINLLSFFSIDQICDFKIAFLWTCWNGLSYIALLSQYLPWFWSERRRLASSWIFSGKALKKVFSSGLHGRGGLSWFPTGEIFTAWTICMVMAAWWDFKHFHQYLHPFRAPVFVSCQPAGCFFGWWHQRQKASRLMAELWTRLPTQPSMYPEPHGL